MTARTKYPNTSNSDKQSSVAHIVTLDSGEEVEVIASDPMQAIQIAMLKDTRYLGKYCSGNHHTCSCGGGWFYGVHITHQMFRINQ